MMDDDTYDFLQTVLKLLINVNVTSDTHCHLYCGDIDPVIGYGRVMIDGIRYNTHRLAAWAHLGLDLSDSKQFACHKCENRSCCNPDHLYVGDNQSNQRDAASGVCKLGHRIEGDNIQWHKRKSGIYYRHCKECHRESSRRNRKPKK